jgi:hypothetical protein
LKVEIRKPTPDDLARFKECLALDEAHAGQDPDEWTAAPGEFMVFYDEQGRRVWCRVERVLRVSMQHEKSKRTALIINQGLRWVIGQARKAGYSEVLFESRAPRLIQFLQKLFGVKPVEGNFYVRT